MEIIVYYLMVILALLVLTLVGANFLQTKRNYYKSYDGVIQLTSYKKKTQKENEVVEHRINQELYFTVEAYWGFIEVKVYANLIGKIQCVESIREDIWGQNNSLIRFKSQWKQQIEQYLLEERQKMFNDTKQKLTQIA